MHCLPLILLSLFVPGILIEYFWKRRVKQIDLQIPQSIATLAKEFVMMGGGLYANKGAIDPGAIDARREFNWWFDAEATRIVLRAPWKKMTITPIDISVKTRYTTEMKATVTKAGTPVTDYLEKYSLPGYMWDEIAGIALIDPSIITAV